MPRKKILRKCIATYVEGKRIKRKIKEFSSQEGAHCGASCGSWTSVASIVSLLCKSLREKVKSMKSSEKNAILSFLEVQFTLQFG